MRATPTLGYYQAGVATCQLEISTQTKEQCTRKSEAGFNAVLQHHVPQSAPTTPQPLHPIRCTLAAIPSALPAFPYCSSASPNTVLWTTDRGHMLQCDHRPGQAAIARRTISR